MGLATINTNYSFDLSRHQTTLLILILAGACAGVLAHTFLGYFGGDHSGRAFGSDDAFISYRYAENLINDHGIVFNPGERVEGYSNFLYVLLMTPGLLFGDDYIYLYSVSINSILLFLSIVSFYRLISLKINATYGLIGAALLGLNPSIWANTATGLETTLVLLTFLLLWNAVESPRNNANTIWLLVISTISIVARVDGFIFPLIAALYLLINKERKTAILLGSYVVLLMAIYTLFRYNYYNDFISNTYYAKVSGNIVERLSAGLLFLAKNTALNTIALYFIFTSLVLISPLIRRKKACISFPLVFFVIWTAYMIYIGGDIYYERFLLPLLTIGIYFSLIYLQRFTDKQLKALLVLFFFSSGFFVFSFDSRFTYQHKTYDMWVNLGKFLQSVPDDYLLAISAAGKVPYYSKLRTLDMLGLNDKVIGKMDADQKHFVAAHTKFDPEYTLSREPHLLATWIAPNFDMKYDMTRDKYEDKYAIKYLVNASRNDLTCNIIDAQGLPKQVVSAIIKEGVFYYAVIARNDILNSLPHVDKQCQDFLIQDK